MSEGLFEARPWSDGKTRYPGRRIIEYGDGTSKTVMVERDEGTITEPGDKFDAATMNDLERRIEEAFKELNDQLNSVKAQLDLYYPPGKILMSMVDFKLETSEGVENIFPGSGSTWVRLQDERILLPVTGGQNNTAGMTNDNVRKRSYQFPADTQITAAGVSLTKLTAAQIPHHSHAFIDYYKCANVSGGLYVKYYVEKWTYKGKEHSVWFDDFENDETVSGSLVASQNIQHGTDWYGYGNSNGHNHPYSMYTSCSPGTGSSIQTEQRCIKVYMWQRKT